METKKKCGPRQTPLTEKQIQAMIKYYTTKQTNIIKVAKKWHTDPRRVRAIFDERNVPKKQSGGKIYDFSKIDELNKLGKTVTEMVKVTGISRYAITKYIKEHLSGINPNILIKRNITINVGDRIVRRYKEDGRGSHERDGVIQIMIVQDVNPDKIVCMHDEGYTETFSKFDLVQLFTTGQMKKEIVE